MGTIASQITSLTIVYSTVYSSADQRKHQSSVSLAFVRGIYRGPVNSPHKWPVTRNMFPFDDVIMKYIKGCTDSSFVDGVFPCELNQANGVTLFIFHNDFVHINYCPVSISSTCFKTDSETYVQPRIGFGKKSDAENNNNFIDRDDIAVGVFLDLSVSNPSTLSTLILCCYLSVCFFACFVFFMSVSCRQWRTLVWLLCLPVIKTYLLLCVVN